MITILLILIALFIIASTWGAALVISLPDHDTAQRIAEYLLLPLSGLLEILVTTLEIIEDESTNDPVLAAGIATLITAATLITLFLLV